jgi:hypothetical protein
LIVLFLAFSFLLDPLYRDAGNPEDESIETQPENEMTNQTLISYVTTAGKFVVHKEGCKGMARIFFSTTKITAEQAAADRRTNYCKKCFPSK